MRQPVSTSQWQSEAAAGSEGNVGDRGAVRHGDGGEVQLGAGPDGGQEGQVDQRAPLFLPSKMGDGERLAQTGVPGRVPGQHHQVSTLGVGHAGLRPGQAQGDLGAEDRRQAGWTGCLGEADHSVHAVVVGDRQGGEAEVHRLFDQLLGVGGAVQEAEVRVAVQLGVESPFAHSPILRTYVRYGKGYAVVAKVEPEEGDGAVA